MNPNGQDPKHGPLQIVHDFKFVALNVKDDYSIIDTLNHTEKVEYIKSRIDRLFALGYGGLVMNVDYRGYLRDPNDFALFFECAKYAKSLGMRVWIYDEQYYPSGGAGGLVLVDHPELEAVALACVSRDVTVGNHAEAIRIASPSGYSELKYAIIAPIEDGEVNHKKRRIVSEYRDLGGGFCYNAPVGKWRVWCFFLRPLFELTKFARGTRASRRYVSIYNKKAIERFYDVTFRNGYCAHAGCKLSDVVDAVFTDEPYTPFYKDMHITEDDGVKTFMPSESIFDKSHPDIKIYPYVPWELTLPEQFLQRYGHSIDESLPDIFDETPRTRGERVKFYTLLSDMSREAFAKQMADRLGNEGVIFSGHYYGEEGFDFQPIFHGDILDHLGVMGIPGCDSLWSGLDRLRYSIACKTASSAAHIYSRKRVMIEASNMVDRDQNITLAGAKAAISVMFAHGVNLVTSYYGEHLLPDEEMREFTRHISALSEIADGGKYRINTLLYYPFENLAPARYPMGIIEGNDNGEDTFKIAKTAATLMGHQVTFDIINKKNLLASEICDGYIKTAYGEKVEYIVFPEIPWLDSEVAQFLSRATENGVKVIFDGEKHEICKEFFETSFISDGIYPKSRLSLSVENTYVLSSEFSFDDYDLFMLTNTDGADFDGEIIIKQGESSAPMLIDPTTRKGERIDFSHRNDGDITARIHIPKTESVFIKITKN